MFLGASDFFGGADLLKLFRRAENEISALFPGKRAETGRKINLRPFSRKKGGFFIFRLGGGRRAEGGFYRRPLAASPQITVLDGDGMGQKNDEAICILNAPKTNWSPSLLLVDPHLD